MAQTSPTTTTTTRSLRALWRALLRGGPAGRAGRGGFTLLEILIAVIIVVIGLVGVMAMQIVAIQANATARDTSEATMLAEQFAVALEQDATFWTTGADLSATAWLADGAADEDVWQVVTATEMVNGMGVAATTLDAREKGRARFCIAYKLRWAVANEALTGFVRVYWQRIGGEKVLDACGTGSDTTMTVEKLDDSSRGVHMVTLPVTVRRTHVD